MSGLLLTGARVVAPRDGLDGVCEVLVRDTTIAAVGPKLEAGGARRVDLDGLVLAPGFIDMHVHLREPGQELKETIASGSEAAVTGGFTAIAPMANTAPVNDCRAVTELVVHAAERADLARVWPVGAVSRGLEGRELAALGAMKAAGVVALSDDGRPIMDASLMRRALEYSRVLDLPVLVHEQDESLVGRGLMNEGAVSTRLGLAGWPAAGEDAMIARDLMLAQDFGGRLHIQHLSTARGLGLVRFARACGLPVTCEATPHHLTLSEDALAERPFDTDLKMNPPLRTERDRLGLVEGLLAGTIDAIATDHAPHHPDEKRATFCCAPFGTIGLESAVAVCLTRLLHESELPLSRLVELFSCGPAQALGVEGGRLEPGRPADLTVLDLEREGRVEPERFRSLSRNCAFAGMATRGAPVLTIVGGRIVHDAR